MGNSHYLSRLVAELGVSVNRFEKEIGAGQGTVSKVINDKEGKKYLSNTTIQKIVDRYPIVNIDWVRSSGKRGDMFMTTITNEPSVSYNTKNHGQEINKLLRDMALTTIELTGPADALQRLRDQIKSLGKIADELEGE